MRKSTAEEALVYVGWVRGPDRIWRKVCEEGTQAACLARLLMLHRDQPNIDRTVLPLNVSPCRRPEAVRSAPAAPPGQRPVPPQRWDLSCVTGIWSGWKKETARSGWELVISGTLSEVSARLKEIHESVRDTRITRGTRKPSYRRSG